LETEKVNAIYRVSCNAGVKEREKQSCLEKAIPPLVKLVEAVREVSLSADPRIGEKHRRDFSEKT
jgi:hypothetical protein